MEENTDNKIQQGDGQQQLAQEPSRNLVPASLSTPHETGSDFYDTPLTGHTPVYSAADTMAELNKDNTKPDALPDSAPAIPGLSIHNDAISSKPFEEDNQNQLALPVECQNAESHDNMITETHAAHQTPNPNESAVTTDVMETEGITVDQHTTAEDEHPEWEADSSPYESSTDSSTDSSDSDEGEEDYPILSAEETARILMQAEGGSDDEGDAKTGGRSHLRTANEQMEDAPPIPDITVTPDMKIVLLGRVESIVENIVLIRATVSWDYQVLESNSLLCLEDKTVVGVIADTLGRVEEPLYTVRYQDPTKIQEFGLENGKQIYYVEGHSEFVFTQPLKGMKGSDASNFHDEEVGEDEIEFSDDEAEAEYKRRAKQRKKEKRENRGDTNESARSIPGPSPLGRNELNYDDDGGRTGEDGYTPLARPKNYHEMMNHQEAHVEAAPISNSRGNFRGRGRGRGSFQRGGPGRGRGSDRRGRGIFHSHYSADAAHTSPSMTQYQNFFSTTFPAQQQTQYPPFPQQSQQQQPPQQTQFLPFGQAQIAGAPQFPIQMPYQQKLYQDLPVGAHINPEFFAAMQQYQQRHQQQQQQQQQQPVAPPTVQNQTSPNNQSTFSQVQAQLDILRQLSGNGNVFPPR